METFKIYVYKIANFLSRTVFNFRAVIDLFTILHKRYKFQVSVLIVF